jgi:hypothetical protein
LFDNPDSVAGGYDSAIIEEVNKRLINNPEADIPNGYVKRMEKRVYYEYNLPNTLPIDETYRVSYETLDLIMFNMLGIRLLEPLSELGFIAKIEPAKKKKVKSTYMDTSKWLSKIEERAKEKNKLDPKSFNCGNFMTKKLKHKKVKLREEVIAKYRYHGGDYIPIKVNSTKTKRSDYSPFVSQSVNISNRKKFKLV